MVCYR